MRACVVCVRACVVSVRPCVHWCVRACACMRACPCVRTSARRRSGAPPRIRMSTHGAALAHYTYARVQATNRKDDFGKVQIASYGDARPLDNQGLLTGWLQWFKQHTRHLELMHWQIQHRLCDNVSRNRTSDATDTGKSTRHKCVAANAGMLRRLPFKRRLPMFTRQCHHTGAHSRGNIQSDLRGWGLLHHIFWLRQYMLNLRCV